MIFRPGIYGGYFGAAQGVILLSLLGIFIADDLQRLNGVKNVLATIANGVAAIVFVFAADVAWEVAALIAVGSIIGGQFGAHFGRRLPAPVLRVVIVVVGVIAAVRLLVASCFPARCRASGRSRRRSRRPHPSTDSSTIQSPKRTYGVSPVMVVMCRCTIGLLERARWCRARVPSASMTRADARDRRLQHRARGLGRAHLAEREVLRGVPGPAVRAVVGADDDRLGAVAHVVARRADRTPDSKQMTVPILCRRRREHDGSVAGA